MSAFISPCGTYRYLLKREKIVAQPMKGSALFVMLNPSTADATIDDPTIRRCVGFARSWGCAGIVVANLYALRATNPAELKLHRDPIGPDNDAYLRRLAYEFDDVVFAWGSNAPTDRVDTVARIFKNEGCKRWCLGQNKNGSPKHPLYIRADQPLIEFKLIEARAQ